MKDRDDVYLVVRYTEGGCTVCSAHATLEGATNEADNNLQKMKDRGFDDFDYDVWITTYYE